jgi:hypothetical protein
MASTMPPTMASTMPSTTSSIPGLSVGTNANALTTTQKSLIMSGGRYKKYSKKGGNTIYTPGADFSSKPAEIATQMDPLSQLEHIPKGGFAMKDMSGVDAQMMASEPPMTGGRYKKYSKKGGNFIYTPGADFSSKPAEIATQMSLLSQSQHVPKGGFAMKDMSGVQAQMMGSLRGGENKKDVHSSIDFALKGGNKKSSKKLKGGVSDFATTLSSRGPINSPDTLSAQRFRYFNKTGTFIPNSQLQYAAAPISTGYELDQNSYPLAYNDYIGGALKKNKSQKKSSEKKKAESKKKMASNKKEKKEKKDKKTKKDKKYEK